MAKKQRAIHTCSECGYSSPKWLGRCPECGSWGTLEEAAPIFTASMAAGLGSGAQASGARGSAAAGSGGFGSRGRGSGSSRRSGLAPSSAAVPITQISAQSAKSMHTGIGELDRVLGDGIVAGSVVLMAGEPGVGKSTLLLEVAARWSQVPKTSNLETSNDDAAAGDQPTTRTALYVTAEESAAQVYSRAKRTGGLSPTLYLAAESDLDVVFQQVEALRPSLIIVDSVQTMQATGVEGVAGGVAQSRAVTAALTTLAKTTGIPILLVGHVTKDGNVAGPRVLEHLVDVVLNFEGERQSSLRMLRGIKNRFGATDEVGCFEQTADGIREVADPSGLFLSHHGATPNGSAVTVAMDGVRPIVAEVQSLTVDPVAKNPRRVVTGLDQNRIPLVLAVLQARAGERTNEKDAYVATVGGVRITDTATDLAVALATWSSLHETPLPAKTVFIGEIGLAGEMRTVPNLKRRLQEAARIGYRCAVAPSRNNEEDRALAKELAAEGLELRSVGTLRQALAVVRELRG
ncbi:DNA repair protein RadA [Corynebacterium propinquum]|uniref:DNA repair protein RadA n=1 Tax=Corynebacterium propinquum TaxID=43769 RepID=UPI000665752D|nr:DNA repair protein RadA [Corynebacterium propinquum]MDK4234875.1 DNA repair protein RadA [Corynebacterium propinquum]RUP78326.1 DNA repair protein RadA [Corynebacterium propinquum]RUP88362.1 DNA repair protein RadA [Corynebacterium propinquum]RUP93830.1 DNA repair protein RadA [Corynebacterium propinquum]WKS31307.1 DNA repair protein RadA [Corynebacterium propinquum]